LANEHDISYPIIVQEAQVLLVDGECDFVEGIESFATVDFPEPEEPMRNVS
jgi:hypothetical protein